MAYGSVQKDDVRGRVFTYMPFLPSSKTGREEGNVSRRSILKVKVGSQKTSGIASLVSLRYGETMPYLVLPLSFLGTVVVCITTINVDSEDKVVADNATFMDIQKDEAVATFYEEEGNVAKKKV